MEEGTAGGGGSSMKSQCIRRVFFANVHVHEHVHVHVGSQGVCVRMCDYDLGFMFRLLANSLLASDCCNVVY